MFYLLSSRCTATDGSSSSIRCTRALLYHLLWHFFNCSRLSSRRSRRKQYVYASISSIFCLHHILLRIRLKSSMNIHLTFCYSKLMCKSIPIVSTIPSRLTSQTLKSFATHQKYINSSKRKKFNFSPQETLPVCRRNLFCCLKQRSFGTTSRFHL